MVLINESSIIGTVFLNYTYNVFGSYMTASMVLLTLLIIVSLLIRIPMILTFLVCVPLIIVFMALNFVPMLMGGLLIMLMMALAGVTFIIGLTE